MSDKLSDAQINILTVLHEMPAKHKNGSWIEWKYLQIYDWRTVQSLVRRGLVEQSGSRFRLTKEGRAVL
jgi:hypothetical protein